MKKIVSFGFMAVVIFSAFAFTKNNIIYVHFLNNSFSKLDSLISKVNPVADTRVLSPEESLAAFRVPSGFHVELVASEPMIHEPVAIAWDGNARMYVCEMRTYMQDADAKGEYEAVSRIMLLDDTDGDGKMDKSSVFIDSLSLPRMILCANHELIVNETDTYNLWSYKDTNNDGKADEKRKVYDVKMAAPGNLEHQRSGLDWNLDNWIYMTVDPVRLKYKNGKMIADSLHSGSNGQWGLTHDNYGKLFFSRGGGENAGSGFQINPKYGALEFADAYDEATFGPVWSLISNADAQGGLRRLRPDSTLNHFTAGCGQSIYRGDKLGKGLQGDYLICEPVARIIRRANVVNNHGKTQLVNVYQQQEFIASTDFYFRPNNTYTSPDGNLYIVDMSRGIVQESQWTPKGSWIRNQINRLGLEKVKQNGRIWRLVKDGESPSARPNMLNENSRQLVKHLANPNGWWRDNAQKQIILLGDKSVIPTLKKVLAGQAISQIQNIDALAKIHALWTLEGLDALDFDTALKALSDSDAQVRRQAIWAAESFVRKNNTPIIDKIIALSHDENEEVKIQALLTLSQSKSTKTKEAVKSILNINKENPVFLAIDNSLKKNDEYKNFGSKLGRLSVEERDLVLKGSETFKAFCSSCHGLDGKGLASKIAPPLVGSKHLVEKEMLQKILMNGLSGPVDGITYPTIMPPLSENNDEYIASVASFIRFQFGVAPPPTPKNPNADKMVILSEEERAKLQNRPNNGNFVNTYSRPLGGIKVDEVKAIRKDFGNKNAPWTIDELEVKK